MRQPAQMPSLSRRGLSREIPAMALGGLAAGAAVRHQIVPGADHYHLARGRAATTFLGAVCSLTIQERPA